MRIDNKIKCYLCTPHIKNVFLALLIFVISSCGDSVLQLSENSIIYCSESSPDSFNPQISASGTAIDATSHQLYNRLLTFDNKHHIAPSLAKSWHITANGKTITFYLEKNVKFHKTAYFSPTRAMNANDVIFSFNRILDPTHPYHHVSGGRYPFFESVNFSSHIEKVEKVNDYTIRFILTKPDSSFLSNLATDFPVILSKEYSEQLIKNETPQYIDTLPIGTGPFKLDEYRVSSFIRYKRHNKYWEGAVPLKQLVFDITPNNTGRLTKLLTNECDVIAYPIAHNKLKSHDEFTLDSVTAFNVGYLAFNTEKPPFDNILVRKAISHAINKQAIIDTVFFGKAEIAKTILPKHSWAYDGNIKGATFDVALAQSLLTEAGYENGFDMDVWAMPVSRAYNPNSRTMAKMIQENLSKIGIKVNIVSNYEWSTFLKKIEMGEHQTVLLGWTADHPDPDNFFTPILSCAANRSGNNKTRWCNESFDLLLEKSLQTDDMKKRMDYYSQALTIINHDIPLLPIAHSKRFQARSKKVKGRILNAFGGIDFTKVTKQ
jgi:cationic peptide transport system substrate-binding protein